MLRNGNLRFACLIAFGVAVLSPLALAGTPPRVMSGSTSASSFLVDSSGALFAWGDNSYGLLGLNGYKPQTTPSIAPFPSGVQGWKALATGEGFSAGWTLAISDKDELYGAGLIALAPYPYGTTLQVLSPLPAPEGAGWAEVAAGSSAYLALTKNGNLYGWMMTGGRALYPLAPNGKRWQHVAISEDEVLTIATDGRLYRSTVFLSSPPLVEVPLPAGATAWTNVSAGGQFAMALANDGQLYGWGANAVGQLGIGSSTSPTNVPQRVALPPGETGWKSIACGAFHTLALTMGGQVYAWGYNDHGQLGLGHTMNQFSPVKVPGLTNVSVIAAGWEHSLAISDCTAWSWGQNNNGQLGAGFTSAFWPSPQHPIFNGDICATSVPTLPVVSLTALDDRASEGTWLSTPSHPVTNTASFQVTRSMTTNSPLVVYYQVSGTASNGLDYLRLPGSITIPANSNSVATLIVPTMSTLAMDPATINISLLPDTTYLLGNATNAVISLVQYQSMSRPPLPQLTIDLFVGTTHEGEAYSILSSTNLIDWTVAGVGTNMHGVVSIVETNTVRYPQRFFSARLLSGN